MLTLRRAWSPEADVPEGCRMTWTHAHRREAEARLHELLATAIRNGRAFAWPSSALDSEATFRAVLHGHAGLDDARVASEVRWVRARAEGRVEETRETVWRVVGRSGAYLRNADGRPSTWETRDDAVSWTDAAHHIVRVTRTRRRIRRTS